MKFGREFAIHLEKTLPEWRDKYLCYNLLKKLLKNIPSAIDEDLPPAVDAPVMRLPLPELQVWFVAILCAEVIKFNDFYVGKEEDLVIHFQVLKEKIKRLKERERNYGYASETEYSEDMTEICKDLVAIHGEMVLLKSYSSLNFAGLIKILKKYDKRTGAMLSVPFTQLAFHQPFFETEPLSGLVHECEGFRETLFPIRAEVVELGVDEHTGTAHADQSHASLETTLSLIEETVGIYQSTLATIDTIEGIKKESSTINPLSMSYLFASRDNDSTGAVTADNSPCHSFVSLHGTDYEIGDVCSVEM